MSNKMFFAVNERGIAVITLNRPEVHHALDDGLIQQLLDCLHKLNQDDHIRLVILKSEGKHFSTGADLNWMRRMVSYTYDENKKDAKALSDLMYTLKFLKHPTLARVQGAAYGGSVGLIACCDIAIASRQALFCFSEVKVGLIPAVISPFVISAIGERAARRYFLTAEPITAEEALHLNLVTSVVAEEELDVLIDKITQELLVNGPRAVRESKALINRMSSAYYCDEYKEKNIETISSIRISDEGQEGLAAFLEKRKPKWI